MKSEYPILQRRVRLVQVSDGNRLLKSIVELHLGSFPDYVRMSHQTIAALDGLRTLEMLSVHANARLGAPWHSLAKLASLRILILNGKIVLIHRDFDAIGRLTTLEHLGIDAKIVCENYAWLEKLRNLRSLDIRLNKLNAHILTALQTLPAIEEFSLRGIALNKDHLLCFSRNFIKNLKYVECEFSFIENHPCLKMICVRGCAGVSREDAPFRGHPSLESVRLTDSIGAKTVLYVEIKREEDLARPNEG